MDEQIKIQINNKLVLYIRKIEYLYDIYKSLVSYIISNNTYNTELFEYYFNKYLEYYTEYQLTKDNINIIIQDITDMPIDIMSKSEWKIDYLSNTVILNIKSGEVKIK